MRYQSRYFSYLLRLWETRDGEEQIWRASLESPGSGERHGFANLESLVEYLQAQTGQIASENERSPVEDEPREAPSSR